MPKDAQLLRLSALGSDTTSTVLAASLFYLSRYVLAYQKVTQEVRSTFSTVADIRTRPLLNKCIYLRACIDESMRMAPPVSSSPFREVEDGGITVDGYYLPSGCDVGTGIYAIHHNSAYYPDPFVFEPERWLVREGDRGRNKEEVDRAHSAFTPFSKGPRSCIGKGLAVIELMSILATLLFVFDFKVADGEEGKLGAGIDGATGGRDRVGEYQLYDHVTAAKEGPVLQFRRRIVDSGVGDHD